MAFQGELSSPLLFALHESMQMNVLLGPFYILIENRLHC